MSISVVGESAAFSLALTEAKRLEDSVLAGRNGYFSSTLQIFQVHESMSLADKALELADQGALPFPLRCVLYLTPPLIAFFVEMGIEDQTMRTVVLFLQDQIGNLCHLAACVSSIAMIFFGNIAFGVTSLTILTIGALDRYGILPERVRQIVHQYSNPVMFISGLLFGDVLNRLFSLINLVSYCVGIYFAWEENQTTPIGDIPQDLLTPQDMLDFLNYSKNVQINRSYIHYPCGPHTIPDVDIRQLLHKFHEIDWNHNMPVLRAKLQADRRFTQIHGDPARKTDRELIDMMNASMTESINSVVERRILKGEMRDYQKLVEYLKITTAYLMQEPPSRDLNRIKEHINERTDILFSFAIEGSCGENGYCGSGIFDTAELISARAVGAIEEFTFRAKVLSSAQDFRNQVMQSLYVRLLIPQNAEDSNPVVEGIGRIIDWQDRHNYHAFLNMYANRLGLRKVAANNDEVAVIDPLVKLFSRCTVGRVMEQIFWGELGEEIIPPHTPARLTEAIIDAFGCNRLPTRELYQWLQQWIDRQTSLSTDQKAQLHCDLAQHPPSLFGHALEDYGKLNPAIVRAMLFDMAVLEDQP